MKENKSLTTVFFKIRNIKNELETCFFLIFLTFIVFLVITVSPQLLSKIQPDSNDYIINNGTRKSLYALIHILFEKFEFDLITAQKVILSFSITFLYYALRQNKINILLSLVYVIAVISNIYYTSYSKTILTESLFFSFINFGAGTILLYLKNNKIIFFLSGVLFGAIIAIKSVGPAIAFPFLFISFYLLMKKKDIKSFLIVLCGALLMIIIESSYFYSKNSYRDSVFPAVILGKVFIISGSDNFNIDNFPEYSKEILKESSETFKEVNKFLNEITNPILRADLAADYEVIAQYQFLRSIKNSDDLIKKFQNDTNNLLLIAIRNNFLDYLKISFTHYLGMWSTGAKFIFLDNNVTQIPLKSELNNASGPMDLPNLKVLIVAQIFFLLLLLALTILSIIILMNIFIKKKEVNLFLTFFVFLIQTYIFSVSFTNIATIRYLMPVYPLIIISVIIFINNEFFKINKQVIPND
jgi:hypothetical protein